MIKSKSIFKYFKSINRNINNLLEANLNKLNFKNLLNLSRNSKIILTFVALIILFISYLLLPVFYKQAEVIKELRNELFSKLNLEFNFSSNYNYNFFPKPHFVINELSILKDQNQLSNIKKLKIYISADNLFSLKNIEIKDVIIEEANFNLNSKNYSFILNLLKNDYSDLNFKIKDSNIFFRDSKNEVLFINKIKKIEYYFDVKDKKNILIAENEIFNVPYKIELQDREEIKNIVTKLTLNLLKLKLENQLDYSEEIKLGFSDIVLNKYKSSLKYEIHKNFVKFDYSEKPQNSEYLYKGIINLKPFYSNISGQSDELNLSYFVDPNSLFVQLLKTQILNNSNIDFQSNLKFKKVKNNSNFKDINFVTKIEEGLIDLDKSIFSWKDYANFNLKDSLIYSKEGELILDGRLSIDIINKNEIFKYFLTPKNYRKEIKNLEFNFSYSFDQKTINLSDIKIDGDFNNKVNDILSTLNLSDSKLQNKIYLKNLFNDAIRAYAG